MSLLTKQTSKQTHFGHCSLYAVNTSKVYTWNQIPKDTEVEAAVWDPSVPINSFFEEIQYENTARTRFGECDHIKCDVMLGTKDHRFVNYKVNPVGDPDMKRHYHYRGDWYPADVVNIIAGNGVRYYTWDPNVLMNKVKTFAPSWSDSDMGSFANRAFDIMRPSLEGGLSVPNMLYELKDFKSLWRTVANRGGLRKGEAFPAYVKRMFPNWKQILAKSHLTWEFAIKPLISDVTALVEGLQKVQDQIKQFQSRAGKPQTRHYSEVVEFTPPSYTWSYTTDNRGINYIWSKTPKVEVTRCATMRYTYSIPTMDDMFSRIMAYAASFGFNPFRLSNYWNAIPWSFVVDWVVDIGDLLDKYLSRELVPAKVTIHDFCVSQRSSCVGEIGRSHSDTYLLKDSNGKAPYNEPAFLFTCRRYQRRRMLPSNALTLSLEDISLRKISLAASLLTVLKA